MPVPRIVPFAITTLAFLAGPAPAQGGRIPDFSFIHLSDIHIEPRFDKAPRRERGAETFTWLKEFTAARRRMSPAPAFAVATGDLTEFGVAGRTWETLEELMKSLGLPWYAVCGNHDNTWVAMGPIMRRRHGGWNYSFDRFRCHFVVLNSATIQEPVPCLDRGTLKWLENDLARMHPGRPLFLFMHHSPSSREFAQPAQARLLAAVLDPYNVALIGFGHGHAPTHERFAGGIDCVQGGTTFAGGKKDRRGCNLVTLHQGRLRVHYHFVAGDRKPKLLLDKEIAPWRRNLPPFALTRPTGEEEVKEGKLTLRLRASFPPRFRRDPPLRTTVDGRSRRVAWRGDGKRWWGELDLAGLEPGMHLLSVGEEKAGGRVRQDSVAFDLAGGGLVRRWRRRLEAGIKAAPVVHRDRLYVADLGGTLHVFHRARGSLIWRHRAGAEILAAPLALADRVILAAGDGVVTALDPGGKPLWRYEAGAPVYSSPRAAGGVVYFGDNAGRLHAVDQVSGKRNWLFAGARYAIESAPLVTADRVVFGAWDGHLYALDRRTGKLLWKELGPRSREKTARYYAPADCSPVAAGGRIFTADRGYFLGEYSFEGEFKCVHLKGVAAVAAAPGGTYLTLRGKGNRLTRVGLDGKKAWSVEVPLGRFPVPPVEKAKHILVCSDRGLVTVVDAGTGGTLASRRVTPGTWVMAPLAAGPEGAVYAVGMDGGVTALELAE